MCGSSFSIDLYLNCHQGGFTISHYNNIHDLTARLLGELCHQVMTEPILQSLSGESLWSSSANTSDNARLNSKADGFWACPQQSAFCDVNPTAHSCRNQFLSAYFRCHELEKRHLYKDRVIQVEHGCFNPLVFSTSGGMRTFSERLLQNLQLKGMSLYSSVLSRIRCKISLPKSTRPPYVYVAPILTLLLSPWTSTVHLQNAWSLFNLLLHVLHFLNYLCFI